MSEAGHIVREVVLPRRALPQPKPAIVDGGDCGPCVFAGLVGLPRVAEAYEHYSPRDPIHESWHHNEMVRAVQTAMADDLIDRIVTGVPIWMPPPIRMSFGAPAHEQSLEWFEYIRMGLDAGYYGLTPIDYDGRSGGKGGPDHWVMICGARTLAEKLVLSGGAKATCFHNQILVSNSAPSHPAEEWVDPFKWLRDHGGFAVILTRPME
ncbi:MAG: hypothetical protein ACYTEX_11340 [Planctomycetota bacterium]